MDPSMIGSYTTSLKSVPATRFHRLAQKFVADVERNGMSKWGDRLMLKTLLETSPARSNMNPRTAYKPNE
jgi:hypothetical protein